MSKKRFTRNGTSRLTVNLNNMVINYRVYEQRNIRKRQVLSEAKNNTYNGVDESKGYAAKEQVSCKYVLKFAN